MKYCSACKVRVNNPRERCPLCYATLGRLDDQPEWESYPDYQGLAKRYNLILRILVMVSVMAVSICITVNWLVGHALMWSLIVTANILYMWLAIPVALRRRHSVGFKILVQVFLLAGLVVAVDLITGNNDTWAYDYVLPGLFCTAMLTITVVSIIKRVKVREFILYFVLIALLGFVPLALRAAGLMQVAWPATLSALYAGLSLLSLFIFADSATKSELKKRFHI